jgi:hypothetical protein
MIAQQITYNRSAKQYEFVDQESGEILTAPSGHKHELFKSMLGMLEPELWQTVHNWLEDEPYLERILWRAAELVASNGVETFPGEGSLLAMVQSSDQYGRYAVTIEDGYIACECPFYQEGNAPLDSNGQRTCKHSAAFHLYQRVKEARF